MKFKSYLPYACCAGDTVTIEGQSWLCDTPCSLLGVTEKGEPVVAGSTGAKLNTIELVLANSVRGKFVPGQPPTERKFLGDYLKVNPKKLKGARLVEVLYTGDELILISEDKTYAKLMPLEEDGRYTMDNENLTMSDLRSLGLVDDEAWEQIQRERSQKQRGAIEWRLKRAILAIGQDRAREILDSVRS